MNAAKTAAAGPAIPFAALLAAALSLEPGAAQAEGRAAAPAPRCEGMAEGARCWQQLADKPGCRVWNPSYYGNETLAWSGRCSGGIATGSGKLTGRWPGGGGTIEAAGELRGGRCHGRWTYRIWGGKVLGGNEGEFACVDGEPHGRLLARWPGGTVEEDPYVDGERHGRSFRRWPNGWCTWTDYDRGEEVGSGGGKTCVRTRGIAGGGGQ